MYNKYYTMTDDLYDVNKYSDKELYDILDMNNPTDRELEAKIIHLINKYDNMQNDSGDKLSIFFQNIYNHFFNNENENEAFTNPTPNPKSTFSPTDYQFSVNDIELDKLKLGKTAITNNSTTPKFDEKLTTENVTDANKITKNREIGKEIISVQQFDYSADSNQLNPIKKQTIKRIISIDSQYRNKTEGMTTSFSFDLSEPLQNVVSLKLYSVQIPYTWYTIPKSYGSNFFYLKGNAPGIKDGNHDYKIEISPGNYSPSELETAINKNFLYISTAPQDQTLPVNSASDVSFNSNDIISYNSNTSKMTINLGLQKLYTESYYEMILPPFFNAYFKFNYNIYDMCSVNTKLQRQIGDDNIRNYMLDNTNNYFTVNVYDDSTNINILHSYVVRLLNINDSSSYYTGSASRNEIMTSLNYTLSNNAYFDKISGIEKHKNKEDDEEFRYRLKIVLNRYTVKYRQNMNVIIVFPNETTSNFRIWTYENIQGYNCFSFDNSKNNLSQIVSENKSSNLSYTIDTSTNILLTCKKSGYSEGNNIIIDISSATQIVMESIISSITDAFNKYTSSSAPVIFDATSNGDELKGAFIDPSTSKFNLTIDLTKKFTTKYYHISLGETSLLSGMKNPDSNEGKYQNYVIGDASWNLERDLLDVSNSNIFTHTIYAVTGGYFVDYSDIFTIKPIKNNTSGNKNAPPVTVSSSLMRSNNTSTYTYANFSDYIEDIQKSMNDTIIDGQQVLSGSYITYDRKYDGKDKYDLSLYIAYNYELTEIDYDISFIDHTYDITSNDNIWKIFDISSNYDLSINKSKNNSYSIITGGTDISSSKINVIDGSNAFILQTNNTSYNIPYDKIKFVIPAGTYTNYEICRIINEKFAQEPKLKGSMISQDITDSKSYTTLNIKINNIYTTKDYDIVFYDPISFAKCYIGSRSVQSTTWDSTLGWILGFRDYTQYSLTLDNKNGAKYLSSSDGQYTYAETVTDYTTTIVNITLQGDTTVSTNLYNYFLISLDDFIQNHLNDGLVTITRKETSLSIQNYLYKTSQVCDPITNELMSNTIPTNSSNGVTKNQLYSLNQSIYSQRNQIKPYSSGPFIKDLFGFIPIKAPSKNGDYYVEFGGSLQNQERLYFGPVNIRKMAIQLLNDRGDLVDLNNTNWSFSFICEQLYSVGPSGTT